MESSETKNETVFVTTFYNNIEANIVKGRLESEGVSCFLTNENFSTLMPHLNYLAGGGTHLFVLQSDYQLAVSILNEIETPNRVADRVVCARCQSSDVRLGLGKSKLKKLTIIFLSALFGMQFSNIKPSYICRNCKNEF